MLFSDVHWFSKRFEHVFFFFFLDVARNEVDGATREFIFGKFLGNKFSRTGCASSRTSVRTFLKASPARLFVYTALRVRLLRRSLTFYYLKLIDSFFLLHLRLGFRTRWSFDTRSMSPHATGTCQKRRCKDFDRRWTSWRAILNSWPPCFLR